MNFLMEWSCCMHRQWWNDILPNELREFLLLSCLLGALHFFPLNWISLPLIFINQKWCFQRTICVFYLCQVQAYTGLSAAGQPTSSNSNASSLGTWADLWCEPSSIQDDYYNTQYEYWWDPGLPICLYKGNALKKFLECNFLYLYMRGYMSTISLLPCWYNRWLRSGGG